MCTWTYKLESISFRYHKFGCISGHAGWSMLPIQGHCGLESIVYLKYIYNINNNNNINIYNNNINNNNNDNDNNIMITSDEFNDN